MKVRYFIASMVLVFATAGCYLPMTMTVVDAESSAPIEGAVLLVEWTKTNIKGSADPYTTSYKVVEAVSDKDGNVKLPACFCWFTNDPDVTVYKKGYVAWNNKLIFPGYKKRKDFQWGGKAFRMERFREVNSHDKHVDFIDMAIGASLKLESKKSIFDAYQSERRLSFEERQLIRQRK